METVRKTRKLPEQVADKLREMIIQESLKTGAKLPAEAELMERFGVSRSTAQLLETRLLIEPSVAALAAVRRQDRQLAMMKTLLDKMDNAYLHGEDYTPYDFEFHSVIAQCTGNDVMMRLLPTIHESIQAGYHHTRRVEGSYQRASQCHLEMYRGILEHDSERARMAAQRHMLQTMHDSGVEVPSVLVK